MQKQQLMMQIRKKKLGLLIADARLASFQSTEACTHAMGVGEAEFISFENGETSPSVPQIESLACFLNIPIQHFWGKESRSADENWDSSNINQRLQTRDKIIGACIRQAREESGDSIEKTAEVIAVEADLLQKYESGQKPIPAPLLETINTIYKFKMDDFLDRSGFIGDWHREKEALEAYHELPENIRNFIGKPVNTPFLELAIRLSEMPAEKLRAIAESLLEITY